ncbi:unnamed protein product [Calicophoron daubneyi]|uniref:Uncharacterized protein n=1 Tax=Calicophoron daubneyi TaxID=300641 RepID=A0AAV2T7J8_CALDB
MEIFPLDGLVVHLLDDSVQCQCTVCQTRQSVGGLTFILFADEIWTEHLPLEEAECRFKNLNPQMHFDHNTMLENIKCCLKDNKRITEYNRATNVFSVVFRFKVEDIVLSWRLETRRAPYSVVLSHLISPLSLALEESTRRQMLLLDRMLKIRSDSNLHGPQPFSSEVFEDSMNKSPVAITNTTKE